MHFAIKFLFRASEEAILGTLKYVSMHFTTNFVFRASGKAILGTRKYWSMCFTIEIYFPRLRRGDFRYTKICVKAFYD